MRTFAYWTLNGPSAFSPMTQVVEMIGGPDRDRTDDLFHAMEARSQLRHRPTLGKDFLYSQTCEPDSQTAVLPCDGGCDRREPGPWPESRWPAEFR
jgi:hypothetical protein